MAKGKITSVSKERGFIFIEDIFCPLRFLNFEPSVGLEVTYEVKTEAGGKRSAFNVKLIPDERFVDYLADLKGGYFNSSGYLKKEFSIDYSVYLAKLFKNNPDVNKSSQIRGFYDHCELLAGKYRLRRDFNYIKAELHKLDSKIENAKKRSNISGDFADFLQANLEEAKKDAKSFKEGFMEHFTAIIGYYK